MTVPWKKSHSIKGHDIMSGGEGGGGGYISLGMWEEKKEPVHGSIEVMEEQNCCDCDNWLLLLQRAIF